MLINILSVHVHYLYYLSTIMYSILVYLFLLTFQTKYLVLITCILKYNKYILL